MALFIYITPICQEEAQRHNCWDDVLKFKEKVLKDQNTVRFDHFPPPYLKKRFQRQHRLVAAERAVKDDIVICFYRLLIRGGNTYRDFKNNPKEYGERHFEPMVSEDALKEWHQKQLVEDPPPQKPLPSEEENKYLWNIAANKSSNKEDIFLYESRDWIKQIEAPHIQNLLYPIREAIFDEIHKPDPFKNKFVNLDKGKDMTIIGRYFPQSQRVFLAGIAEGKKGDDLPDRYNHLLFADELEISEEELLSNCAKSYPALVLLDNDAWMAIERNEESNLALSPEETNLLRSVHDLQENEEQGTGFPLFINGRAGSGKSTILQYLFADYLAAHLKFKSNQIEAPIYLTYSKELVNKSRSVVKSLIKNGAQFIFEEALADDEQEILLDDSFQEFHNFLFNLLNEKGKAIFKEGLFVDYRIFCQLWEDRFGTVPKATKDYGPELSWHVIRTYIKGMSVDGEMDVDEYMELPNDERSVSRKTFQLVYDKVYQGWYSALCKDNSEYWDAQDLIRYLLQNEGITPKYPAVFCDEAQDFTRVELEAILRLNLFSGRSLTGQDLERVPFAFAGDPLQTLNPTGFRWEAIKSAFVQKFIHSLDPRYRFGNRQSLNYKELSYNYRSSVHIVKLNNSIQALRFLLFGEIGISPQLTWHLEERSSIPAYFNIEDEPVQDELESQIGLIIIVPCPEGGEKEFVDEDDYLNDIVERDEKGTPRNVFSPGRAKGLEFDRVVVYGFGHYIPDTFVEYFDTTGDWQTNNSDPDQLLAYEYFINRLYVATSRPKKQLLVVDTTQGLKQLWNFATELGQRIKIMERLKNSRHLWDNQLGNLIQGTPEMWVQDQENPETLARKLEAEGKSGDYMLLRNAAMIWRQVGKEQHASRCLGMALEMEGDYRESGDAFVKAREYESALKTYWKGSAFDQIAKMSVEEFSEKPIKWRIASLICSEQVEKSQLVDLLQELIDEFESGKLYKALLADSIWAKAIDALVEKIPLNHLDELKLRILSKQLVKLLDAGVSISRLPLAKVLFAAEMNDQLRKVLRSLSESQKQDPLFNKLALQSATKVEEKEGIESLEADEKQLLISHYRRENQYEKAAVILKTSGQPQQMAELIHEELTYFNEINNQLASHLHTLLEKCCRSNQWEQAVQLAFKGKHNTIRGNAAGLMKDHIHQNKAAFLKTFIREVATSPTLPINPNHQKEVSQSLKDMVRLDSSYTEDIHPIVLGAAYERAGNHFETLKYYRGILKSKALVSREEKIFVRRRWLRCQLKRADYLEKAESKVEQAAEERNKATERAKKWKINEPLTEIPEFPIVTEWLDKTPQQPAEPEVEVAEPEPEPITELQDTPQQENFPEEVAPQEIEQPEPLGPPNRQEPSRVYPKIEEIVLDNLRITCSRELRKIKIDHKARLESATVALNGSSFSLRSSDVSIKENGSDEMHIPEWDMSVATSLEKIEIRLESRGIALSFLGLL